VWWRIICLLLTAVLLLLQNSWWGARVRVRLRQHNEHRTPLIIFHKKGTPIIPRLQQGSCAHRRRASVNPAVVGRCYLPHQFKPLVVAICAELVPKCCKMWPLSRTHRHHKPPKLN
ncbi:unnamed protein product, partial [Pylaiella littoralis]